MILTKCLSAERFEIPSERAQKGLLCAVKLLEWMKKNEEQAGEFAMTLVKSLQNCCSYKRAVKFHSLKEHMCENYHKQCSSEAFRRHWATVIKKIGRQPDPTLYQFVTDEMWTCIIQDIFPVINDDTLTPELINFEQSNALRYTAGYVLRAVSKKVNGSAHLHKVELLSCIKELCEGTYALLRYSHYTICCIIAYTIYR
jgi:hypothetical protein